MFVRRTGKGEKKGNKEKKVLEFPKCGGQSGLLGVRS